MVRGVFVDGRQRGGAVTAVWDDDDDVRTRAGLVYQDRGRGVSQLPLLRVTCETGLGLGLGVIYRTRPRGVSQSPLLRARGKAHSMSA